MKDYDFTLHILDKKSIFSCRLHKLIKLFYILFSHITYWVKYLSSCLVYIVDYFPFNIYHTIKIIISKIYQRNKWWQYSASIQKYGCGLVNTVGFCMYSNSAYMNYKLKDNALGKYVVLVKAERKSNTKRTDTQEFIYHKLKISKRIITASSDSKKLFPKAIHAVTLNVFLLKVNNYLSLRNYLNFFNYYLY